MTHAYNIGFDCTYNEICHVSHTYKNTCQHMQWIIFAIYWRFQVQGCMLKVEQRFDLTCESVITTVLTEQHNGISV